jgi:hypothetical protein
VNFLIRLIYGCTAITYSYISRNEAIGVSIGDDEDVAMSNMKISRRTYSCKSYTIGNGSEEKRIIIWLLFGSNSIVTWLQYIP